MAVEVTVAASKSVITSGRAKATIDHEEIRQWVEAHGGHPAMVKSTARDGTAGILRIDFPGYSAERSLKAVSWAAFFDKFEASELAFLYQDQTKSGRPSRFNKLVSRETLPENGARTNGRRSSTRARGRTSSPSTNGRPAAAKRSGEKGTRGATSRTAASRAGQTKKKAAISRG
jgi:hypothetical protein